MNLLVSLCKIYSLNQVIKNAPLQAPSHTHTIYDDIHTHRDTHTHMQSSNQPQPQEYEDSHSLLLRLTEGVCDCALSSDSEVKSEAWRTVYELSCLIGALPTVKHTNNSTNTYSNDINVSNNNTNNTINIWHLFSSIIFELNDFFLVKSARMNSQFLFMKFQDKPS